MIRAVVIAYGYGLVLSYVVYDIGRDAPDGRNPLEVVADLGNSATPGGF